MCVSVGTCKRVHAISFMTRLKSKNIRGCDKIATAEQGKQHCKHIKKRKVTNSLPCLLDAGHALYSITHL